MRPPLRLAGKIFNLPTIVNVNRRVAMIGAKRIGVSGDCLSRNTSSVCTVTPASASTSATATASASTTSSSKTLHVFNTIVKLLSQKSIDECREFPFSSYKTVVEPLLLRIRYSQHEFDLILQLYKDGYPEIAYKLQTILAAHWSTSVDVKVTVITSLSLILSRGDVKWTESFVNLLIEKFDDDDYRLFVNSLKSENDKEIDENTDNGNDNDTHLHTPLIAPSNPVQFKHKLANALARFSLNLGFPLLTASLLMQFRADSIYIQTNTIFNCIRGLLVYDAKLNPFHIRAIYDIYTAYPHDRVILDYDMKKSLITNGIRYSKGKYPSFANECFNLAVKLNGDPVPIISAYKMILLNLKYNNVIHASNIWNSVSASLGEVNLENHDRIILSSLLTRLSKDRKFLNLALLIANSLDVKYYNLEGITEGLILTCARSKNIELIEKIYKNLSQPLRRSTLTALLRLHLSLDDSTGVEKLLNEINSRKGDGLSAVELASIIDALAYHDIKRAEIFLQRFSFRPPKLLLRSYASILNNAINTQNWRIYDKYIELMKPFDNTLELSTACCIENIQIKAICKGTTVTTNATFQSAQNLWQTFMTSNRNFYQIRERKIGLNIITDLALQKKTTSKSIIQWIIAEYLNLGLSHNDITQYLRTRRHFESLPHSIQNKWLSALNARNEHTTM